MRTHASHQLLTLGRLSFQDATGRDVDSLVSRRRKLVVLVVLAFSPHAMPRDVLVEMFWGDQDEARARHSLSDALSHLRRVLGTGVVTLRRAEVELSASVRLDVDALELIRAAQERRHADVIQLYGGPFLDGVYVGGSPRLEQWIDHERARLDALFVAACSHECQRLAKLRDWRGCLEIAERWHALAPLSPHAALSRFRAIVGDGTPDSEQRAIDAFNRHASHLRAEYECAPDPLVVNLANELIARRQARALSEAHVADSEPEAVVAVAETVIASGAAIALEAGVTPVNAVEHRRDPAFVQPPLGDGQLRRSSKRRWSLTGVAVSTIGLGTLVGGLAWSTTAASRKEAVVPARSATARDLYSQAGQVTVTGGDRHTAIGLLERAIAADTGFALAYRALAQYYEADAEARDRYTMLLTRAYERASQLPAVERHLTEGAYHTRIAADYARAAQAYRAVLAIDSVNGSAWNNLGAVYDYLGDTKRAAKAYEAAARLRPGRATAWLNLCDARYANGDVAGARAALDSLAHHIPGHYAVYLRGAALSQAEGDLDQAGRELDALRRATAAGDRQQSIAQMLLAKWHWSQGHIVDGDSARRVSMELDRVSGDVVGVWAGFLDLVSAAVWLREDVRTARAELAAARRAQPLDAMPVLDRPYIELAYAYALVGNAKEARVMLEHHEREVPTERRRQQDGAEWLARGHIAVAEGRLEQAARDFERVAGPLCRVCGVAELGDTYARLGRAGEAQKAYARYFSIPSIRRADATDAFHRMRLLRRVSSTH